MSIHVQNVDCNQEFNFQTKGAGYTYECFLVIYSNNLPEDDIICTRHSYFSCFPLLTLDDEQPANPLMDKWCYPIDIGKPLKSLSKTINSDPRLVMLGNSGSEF